MRRIVILAFLMSALLLFSGCGSKKEQNTPAETQKSNDIQTTTAAESVEPDITINNDIYSDKTEFGEGVAAEIYVTAPKAEAPKYGESIESFNQIIEMYVETVKNEYQYDVSVGEGAEGVSSSSRMLSYEIYNAEDGIISVLLTYDCYVGGDAHPTTVYRCITYDLVDNKSLSLTDIISESKVDVLKSMILEKMKETPDSYYSTEPDILDAIDISYSFLLKGDMLYIVFDEYAIAPRSAGKQIFDFKLSDIG